MFISAISAEVEVTLQNGLTAGNSIYNGCSDSYMYNQEPNSNFSADNDIGMLNWICTV